MRLAWPRVLTRGLLLVLIVLAVLVSSPPSGAQADGDNGPVYVMRISGTIDLGQAPYVDRVVAAAEDADAVAIIIEVDTPGGRLDAVIQMRDTIVGSRVPTVALVDATALSAGALVAISSDKIYMTPAAVVGAATPVLGGTGEVAGEKTISAVRAIFESTAEENGRDPQVAAAMVDTRVEIEGLVTDDELLTLTVSEAIEGGYAEGAVTDRDALLVELGLDDNELVVTNLSFAEQLVRFLTYPIIAGLLLLGGILLIIIDFLSGGVGVAAIGGVALLSIFAWGHLLAGLAGWEDIALVAVGIALIAAEAFVLPGFGVAGILGLLALGGGAFMAMIYRDFDFVTDDDLWRAGLTIAITLAAVGVGIVLLIMAVSRRGAVGGLVLSTGSGGDQTFSSRRSIGWLRWFGADDRLVPDRIERPEGDAVVEGSLAGSTGTAVSDLRPGGIADIAGHRIDVVTSGEFILAGEPIEIIRDDRYRRVVRRRP